MQVEQGNLAVKYKSTQRKAVDPQITLLLYGKYRRTNARLSLKSETIKRTTDIVQHNSDQVTTESSTQPYKIRPNKSVSVFRRWYTHVPQTYAHLFCHRYNFHCDVIVGILYLINPRC